MSEPESLRWPRARSGRDAGISAALAALAGASLFGLHHGAHRELAAPPTGPDPVPRERLITRFPPACGLPAKTINELAPSAQPMSSEDFGDCDWFSRYPDLVTERHLKVKIKIWPPTGANTTPMPFAPGNPTYAKTTPTSAAISAIGQIASPPAAKPVIGLGEEAYATSRPSEASVGFRAANAVVTVTYHDGRPRSTGNTLNGAFKAAAQIAGDLRTSATPRLAPQERTPVIRHAPNACAAIPTAVRKQLVENATASPGTNENSCTWTSDRHALMLTIVPEPESALGGPVQAATREYLQRHYDARAQQPISTHDRTYFHALTAPGDQAFASWIENSSPGRIVVRVRNVLLEVTYTDAERTAHHLTEHQAINGAYAAATRAAEHLRE